MDKSYRIEDKDIEYNSCFELESFTSSIYFLQDIDQAFIDYLTITESYEYYCSKKSNYYFIASFNISEGIILRKTVVVVDIKLYKVL